MLIIDPIKCKNVILYGNVSKQVDRNPLSCRRHLLLGRQNRIVVVYGSPNCVLFCFGGRQLSGVENYCSHGCLNLIKEELKN